MGPGSASREGAAHPVLVELRVGAPRSPKAIERARLHAGPLTPLGGATPTGDLTFDARHALTGPEPHCLDAHARTPARASSRAPASTVSSTSPPSPTPSASSPDGCSTRAPRGGGACGAGGRGAAGAGAQRTA